jgi:hypothetical protein
MNKISDSALVVLFAFALLWPTSNEASAGEPHWGSYERTCVQKCCNQRSCIPATTRYAAVLWGIPWGADWEWYCEHTTSTTPPGPPSPNPARVPDRCRNQTTNVWGVWFDQDGWCDNQCEVGGGLKPTQESCEKAGMFWDSVANECVKHLQ